MISTGLANLDPKYNSEWHRLDSALLDVGVAAFELRVAETSSEHRKANEDMTRALEQVNYMAKLFRALSLGTVSRREDGKRPLRVSVPVMLSVKRDVEGETGHIGVRATLGIGSRLMRAEDIVEEGSLPYGKWTHLGDHTVEVEVAG